MTILRLTTPTLIFFALCSCSSQKASQGIPESNPANADLNRTESGRDTSRAPAADPAAVEPTYRIVNYSLPDPNFNVDEDLTVLSTQDKESQNAVAAASGIISASGGSLLRVSTKEEGAIGGEDASAVKQIIANIKRLSSQLKEHLKMVKPFQQVVFFVPMTPEQRDLYHGPDKLSTEPGAQSTQYGQQTINTMALHPMHPMFLNDVDRGIKYKLLEYSQNVKVNGDRAQPAQVLGFRTSVFFYPQQQKGTITAEALIALRSGEVVVNKPMGTGATLSSYNIPFDASGRVTVAVIGVSVGIGSGMEDWGELDIRFGEYSHFRGYTFALRGEPIGPQVASKTSTIAIPPPEAPLNKDTVPRVNIALAGKPDAKAYLGHVKVDLKKMQIRDLDASVGLRWLPAISIDRIQNNSIKSVNVVDQVNAKIDTQVQSALNGGMDEVLAKILGGGAK